jgi:hypothetical protein
MPSPIALSSPPRQDSIFKKRSLSCVRSPQHNLTAVVEADARARIHHSASVTSTPPLSSSATSSEGTFLNDTPYENYDGLAYPIVPPTSEQAISADHLQFGFCPNEHYRYKSAHKPGTKLKEARQQDPPYYIIFTTYLSYLLYICVGHMRDFFGKRLYPAFYCHLLPFDVSHVPMCGLSLSSSRSMVIDLPLDRATHLSTRILIPFTLGGSRSARMIVFSPLSLAFPDELSISLTINPRTTTLPFPSREPRLEPSTSRLTIILGLLKDKVDVQMR